ncbi:MAG: hypothetical protein IBX45_04440 [Campylobacterales bacterium]|nr:hypothetical protein [Campylobacterales bacterium]
MKRTGRFYLLLLGQVLGIGVVLGFIFIDGITLERWLEGEVDFAYPSQECDLRVSPCSITLANGSTMELDIHPRGIPLMTPLSFSLHTTGIQTAELPLKIYATNMDMGIHRFVFSHDGEGRYSAKGILPTCISGNMHWHGEVTLEKQFQGKKIGAQFRFKTK